MFSKEICHDVRGKDDPATTPDPALGAMPEWDLSLFYGGRDDPAIIPDLERLTAQATRFEKKFSGKLKTLAARKTDELADAVREYEALADGAGRIGAFADLIYTQDTSDEERRKFYGDINDRLIGFHRHLIFFELEINRIDDALLDRAAARGELTHYRPWLTDIRRERPHQLEDRVEQLFHEKSATSYSAWNRLYDETLSRLRFKIGKRELALEPALNLLLDPAQETRRKTADALAARFEENLPLFTHITNALAKDKEISDRWRNFSDVAHARHLNNRVEPEIVDALVSAVQQAYPRLSHRYYAMKARWLGMERLNHYDRNAPLAGKNSKIIPFDAAGKRVIEAYRSFSPQMADIASDFFKENRIDAAARPGKAPGAFAHPTVPSARPYVLLNYLGRPRDVMTLAHELGHGIHQTLAAPNGALMAPTPLTFAETASVFGEMLIFRDLLKTAANADEARILRAEKVEDMLNTVVRQIAFYLFERQVHEARRDGELTADRLGEIWLKVQSESLGPSIALGPGYETFWAYIGHFIHSPFYVYAYAFGDCLVNSLYAAYEEGVTDFEGKYIELLKAGGTRHHGELLKPFGLDAHAPAFWQKGLSLIEELIDGLEAEH